MHNLAHPGEKKTFQLIKSRFVWPKMRKDVQLFVRSCESCQKNKINKHIKSNYEKLPTCDNTRFAVLHLDIVGPLPSCEGYKYLLTMIDRETNWLEVVPLRIITTEKIIKALEETWISRFGVPHIIITDQGRQFVSDEFLRFTKVLGIETRKTTAYHPQCNGKIERSHRTIKTAIRTHLDSNGGSWKKNLPWTLLGLRTLVNEDLGSSCQRVYGADIRIPGDMFVDDVGVPQDTEKWKYRETINSFPRNMKSYHRINPYFPKNLKNCKHVWIRRNVIKGLQSPYEGPFEVISRDHNGKTLLIRKAGKQLRISIDNVKPAWLTRTFYNAIG